MTRFDEKYYDEQRYTPEDIVEQIVRASIAKGMTIAEGGDPTMLRLDDAAIEFRVRKHGEAVDAIRRQLARAKVDITYAAIVSFAAILEDSYHWRIAEADAKVARDAIRRLRDAIEWPSSQSPQNSAPCTRVRDDL